MERQNRMKSSKYLINHFSITPENFCSFSNDQNLDNQRKIKALHIPRNGFHPKIFFDEPSKIKSFVFKKDDFSSLILLPLNPFCHMYANSVYVSDSLDRNLVATYLCRYFLSTMTGLTSMNVIFGDVLIFGSLNALTHDHYETDYSVPYEIVEQVARYYDEVIQL
jgi:hypothetical protein